MTRFPIPFPIAGLLLGTVLHVPVAVLQGQEDPPLDSTSPRPVEMRPWKTASLSEDLQEVVVRFSKPVQGVDPADLLINGTPASEVSGMANGPYRFRLEPPQSPPMTLSWAEDHDIRDTASPPNPFQSENWEYSIDQQEPPDVVISELVASNYDGLTDEDGDQPDWIEIRHDGDHPVNLEGWSLTDDPDEPTQWQFPERTLEPGELLVVFASGKDRRPASDHQPLHTNFELDQDGEYAGLYDSGSPPRPVSEWGPEYPLQRTDISYGLDADGQPAYFLAPTPEGANGGETREGVVAPVTVDTPRGFYDSPIDVTLSCATPDATIRYTRDGSPPTRNHGRTYSDPIRIDQTTNLRAAAFKENHIASEVTTHTYLFAEDILAQPPLPEGTPGFWGSSNRTLGDYAMDQRIIDDPDLADEIPDALHSLPTLSITMDMDDLFGLEEGIYSNANQDGIEWERAASVELLPADNADGFQADAGIRMQGGSSTNPWKSFKLSMQLRFRSLYGPGMLTYPLFPDSSAERFDNLILDAHLNYTWHYGGGVSPQEQRRRAQYVRDEFVADLQQISHLPTVSGRFVHYYLNGMYWGIYNLHEKPNNDFAAEYFGGREEDYDVLKHTGSTVLSGDTQAWNEMMALARSGLTNPESYRRMQAQLDIPAFIDYMLINFYVGNTDWPRHNWYAIRRREPAGRFRFFSWDAEHVMKGLHHNRTGANNSNSPGELYQHLKRSREFRLAFADRTRRHFSEGGIFYVNPEDPVWTPENEENNAPASVYMQRVREIHSALLLESARWGDNQRSEPYTRDAEWQDELDWLLQTYFPRRSEIVQEQLRQTGLYPDVPAPSLHPHGGQLAPNDPVTLESDGGTISYTLDGTDPRTPFSGEVAPEAVRYEAGNPVRLDDDTQLRARVRRNGTWSALTEARFRVQEITSPLRVTELMYHPVGGEEYEYLVLRNVDAFPVRLSGMRFDEGISFTFPYPTTLQPTESIVLVSDDHPDRFRERYPNTTVFGTYSGRLSNGGEEIGIRRPNGESLLRFEYDDEDGWPEEADGDGYSLVLNDWSADPSAPGHWRLSNHLGGSLLPPLSDPTGSPELRALGFNGNGAFQLEVRNPTNGSITLEGSSDLVRWEVIDTLEAGESVYELSESPATRQRYYRVVRRN